MKRVILNHCWEGTGSSGWYPAVLRRLRDRGVDASAPDLPDTATPSPGPWREALAAAVGAPDRGTVLIGHSLGAANVLRYLESLEEGQAVAGVVLIAAFAADPQIPAIRAFYERPFDFALLRQRAGRIYSFHSDDDPYARPDPLHHARIFADRLGAKVSVIAGGAHFGPSSGRTDFAEVAARALEALDP